MPSSLGRLPEIVLREWECLDLEWLRVSADLRERKIGQPHARCLRAGELSLALPYFGQSMNKVEPLGV
eukprot:scaffold131634_cov63-Phaeocystis_antarctica.AAC.1